MTLELELTPEQASWLGQRAKESGLTESEALLQALQRQIAKENPLANLSDDESELISELRQEFPEKLTNRFEELTAKSMDHLIAADEQRELAGICELREAFHSARLARVAKIAQLRGADFDEVLREFGLQTEVE